MVRSIIVMIIIITMMMTITMRIKMTAMTMMIRKLITIKMHVLYFLINWWDNSWKFIGNNLSERLQGCNFSLVSIKKCKHKFNNLCWRKYTVKQYNRNKLLYCPLFCEQPLFHYCKLNHDCTLNILIMMILLLLLLTILHKSQKTISPVI